MNEQQIVDTGTKAKHFLPTVSNGLMFFLYLAAVVQVAYFNDAHLVYSALLQNREYWIFVFWLGVCALLSGVLYFFVPISEVGKIIARYIVLYGILLLQFVCILPLGDRLVASANITAADLLNLAYYCAQGFVFVYFIAHPPKKLEGDIKKYPLKVTVGIILSILVGTAALSVLTNWEPISQTTVLFLAGQIGFEIYARRSKAATNMGSK